MIIKDIFDQFPGMMYQLMGNLGLVAAVLCSFCLALREDKRSLRQLALCPKKSGKPGKKNAPRKLPFRQRLQAMLRQPHFSLPLYMLICVPSGILLLVGSELWRTWMTFGNGLKEASFVGGVLEFIPILLGLALFFPRNGSPARQLELVMPGLALKQAFNRVGCLLAGCCFGKPSRFGMVFPNNAPASLVYGPGTRVFPTQLLELVIMLLCAALIIFLHLRGKRTLPIFPLTFGLTGFLLEFVGGVDKGNRLLGMNLQQWAYFILFCYGVFFCFFVRKRKERV